MKLNLSLDTADRIPETFSGLIARENHYVIYSTMYQFLLTVLMWIQNLLKDVA